MGPIGIHFEGRIEESSTEQAREAYLEIADVIAKYTDPSCHPYQKLAKIRENVYSLGRQEKGVLDA
ncbi:hypothetical protein D3C72_2523670 [compost metagenome]